MREQVTKWRTLVFENGPEADYRRNREFARVVDAMEDAYRRGYAAGLEAAAQEWEHDPGIGAKQIRALPVPEREEP